MKWSLNELRQTADEPLMFEETLDLKDSLKQRRPDILDVSDVLVKGIFSVDELGVLGYAKVKVKIVLPSSRSLEPAELDLNFDFTEHYVSYHERDLSRFEDTDVVIVLENDILDLNSVGSDGHIGTYEHPESGEPHAHSGDGASGGAESGTHAKQEHKGGIVGDNTVIENAERLHIRNQLSWTNA